MATEGEEGTEISIITKGSMGVTKEEIISIEADIAIMLIENNKTKGMR